MLSVEEARARVLDSVGAMPVERVPIAEAAGLVLADDLIARHDLPRFDNSAMDGYAVRAADVSGATSTMPVELRILGEIRAGDAPEPPVSPGAAVRIMTGAAVPDGADAIVPIEVANERDGIVDVLEPSSTGTHIRPAGEDVAAGDLVLAAGTELASGELAVAASLGLSPAPVRRGPRVGVLVTGDELVAPEDEPGPGRIRDSNSVALHALVTEAGGEAIRFSNVADERAAVRAALSGAAERCDLVVSSGGVSVGRYDHVKDVLEEIGRIDLWRVAMQPGKPVVLGAIGDTPFLGLPGNPVSIHIGFEQFVRPAIRKMRGCRDLLRPTIDAELTTPLGKKPGRLQFVRVELAFEDGRCYATPTGGQGSHMQSSLIGCDGVARFPADATKLGAGDRVEVEVWRLGAR